MLAADVPLSLHKGSKRFLEEVSTPLARAHIMASFSFSSVFSSNFNSSHLQVIRESPVMELPGRILSSKYISLLTHS
jgi:hypothetical protein